MKKLSRGGTLRINVKIVKRNWRWTGEMNDGRESYGLADSANDTCITERHDH